MKLSGLRLIYYFSKLDSRSVTHENPTGGRGLGGKDRGNGNFRKGVPAIRNIRPRPFAGIDLWYGASHINLTPGTGTGSVAVRAGYIYQGHTAVASAGSLQQGWGRFMIGHSIVDKPHSTADLPVTAPDDLTA